MSSATRPSRTARSRRGFGGKKDDGPRASFGQLLPYLLEHKKVLVWVIVLSVLGAGASLAQPLLVKQVITLVQNGQLLGNLIWILVALVVISALISAVQHYLLQRTGTSVVLSARRRLVQRILRLPISEFDNRRTGDLVSRVGSDTTLLYAVMTQGLVDAVGGALIFVGALIGMLILDPILLAITLGVIGISVVLVVGLSARIRTVSATQQEKVGDLAASVERAVSAIRTVRAAGATQRETEFIEKDAQSAWIMGIKLAKVSALVVPVAGVALQVTLLAIIGVGGYRVASGAITLATLVSFILFLFLIIGPLGQAFGAITSVSQALGALGRIQEIIELPSEEESDAASAALALPPVTSTGAISFDNVYFTYPAGVLPPTSSGSQDVPAAPSTQDLTVLHGVSFSAERGKRTALVGPSGAGKSTILALIERFYDPTAGAVRVDGVDIRSLDRSELRSQIGYVEQDAPVLAGTIRENLLLGSPNATDEECIKVLHDVNLTEVLERNDHGLDAAVGEDGVMLSGGERQRLAIARTLLAAPPILLLDESTSSLDGLNEQLLREAIDAVAENRTLIVIAHRLSTVVDSDSIVVLDHGLVAGIGTHSELVKSTPLYKKLAKHQLLV
jgi:ABC-type multidrug transport system fused ATPase/permease subunit